MRMNQTDKAISVCYWLTESVDAATVEQLDQLLSADERERRDRLRSPRQRHEFTCAHGLLRRTLSDRGDVAPEQWCFEADGYGKPSLVEAQAGSPAFTFNIAHTDGLVACATGRGAAVGVDVERINRISPDGHPGASYFSPSEINMLEGCSNDLYPTRFIELWTLKEAFIKATGRGLSHPLHSFSFAFDEPSLIGFVPPPAVVASLWQFLLAAPTPDHRLAVAVNCDSDDRSPIKISNVGADVQTRFALIRISPRLAVEVS